MVLFKFFSDGKARVFTNVNRLFHAISFIVGSGNCPGVCSRGCAVIFLDFGIRLQTCFEKPTSRPRGTKRYFLGRTKWCWLQGSFLSVFYQGSDPKKNAYILRLCHFEAFETFIECMLLMLFFVQQLFALQAKEGVMKRIEYDWSCSIVTYTLYQWYCFCKKVPCEFATKCNGCIWMHTLPKRV